MVEVQTVVQQSEIDWFREHLESASEEVASWPAWKRGILEASSKSTWDTPRPVVDNTHEGGKMMKVTVLRRNTAHPTRWDMLFQDCSFGNVDAIIRNVQQNYTCVTGDELIVIMDDEIRRVKMVPATLEAEWLPTTKETA